MGMIDAAEAYPLAWPDGMKRTRYPDYSRFGDHTFRQAHDAVSWELQKSGINAYRIVISTNWGFTKTGALLSYIRVKNELRSDPGAAVYWTVNKGRTKDNRVIEKEYCMACDQYNKVECNLWAIFKSVEELRGLERWGCSDILERAFRGFEALPAPPPWWTVLGFNDRPDTLSAARQGYIGQSKKYHPDSGSEPDEYRMREVNSAYETAKADYGETGA